MISFTQGLAIFTCAFTVVYTLILMFSERTGFKSACESSLSQLKYCVIFTMVLTLVLFVCVSVLGFKGNSLYSFLLPITALLMLFMLRSSNARTPMWIKKTLLFLAILFHVIIVYNSYYGASIDERHPALARIAIEGFYDTSRSLLNPVYNPLPMDSALFLILFYVTGLSPIASTTQWLISFFIVLTIDLVLYSLVIKLMGEWILGILAILILAITPPLNFLEHYCKLAGMMLVLISIFMLTKVFKEGRTSLSTILTSITSYIVAIFYHPTAGLELFALFGVLLGSFLLKNSNEEAKAVLKIPLFRAFLVYLTVITLARWIYGGGFELLVLSMRNYIIGMFQWEVEEKLVPLYERAGVDPIQSYAWSTPVAMAGALILYTLLKKKIRYSVLIPSLAMGGAFFLSIGLVGAYLRIGGFHASMYPGFILLIPSAALVTLRALRSSSKLIAIFSILLVVLSASVAIRDPMIMRIYIFQKESGKIIGGGYFVVRDEELIIIRSILSFIPIDKVIKTSLAPGFLYLNPYSNVEAFVGSPGDPKYERDYRLLLQGRIEDNAIYVINIVQLPKTLLYEGVNGTTINLLYNTNQYVVFIKVG